MLRVLDLFSGIGGFSLGLERAGGFETVAFCEIDPFCRRVLAKHWPKVKCYEDVRTLTAETLQRDGIAADVICGGFPCQDLSEANPDGDGLDGERSGLWREMGRLVGEVRPRYVIVENVSNLLGRGHGRVLGDLAAIGFDAEWHSISASDMAAAHERERIWIVAYPNSANWRPIDRARGRDTRHDPLLSGPQGASRSSRSAQTAWPCSWAKAHARFSRLDDGLSCGVDEYNAYANAVVPQIPELIGRAILAAGNDLKAAHPESDSTQERK